MYYNLNTLLILFCATFEYPGSVNNQLSRYVFSEESMYIMQSGPDRSFNVDLITNVSSP